MQLWKYTNRLVIYPTMNPFYHTHTVYEFYGILDQYLQKGPNDDRALSASRIFFLSALIKDKQRSEIFDLEKIQPDLADKLLEVLQVADEWDVPVDLARLKLMTELSLNTKTRGLPTGQGMTNELAELKIGKNLNWAELFNLYEASPNQQQAIDELLGCVYGFNMPSLKREIDEAIVIPDDIGIINTITKIDGVFYGHCEEDGSNYPLVEYYNRYRVLFKEKNKSDSILIGSAPTLEQAYIKATLYAHRYDSNKPRIMAYQESLLDIVHSGKIVSQAKVTRNLESKPVPNPKNGLSSNIKLTWAVTPKYGLNDLELELKTFIEMAENSSYSANQISFIAKRISEIKLRLAEYNSDFDEPRRKGILYKAEKRLGLRNAIRQQFEEDMGL